ncbi:short-chain dehydrogenase/reductase SDR [Sphingobium chlorophenolicum L-1]|uniref:Short-chain dehydrogenase/reductase SDR n=1 Tax=Sphingobium chlorophenolicum L-1 TaxID=690566 RepID=F6F334_SPHCR|nr:SDR family oxidoreductase [Sphingobium chlorophenolicum]AEG50846.1 short-chain dehydrogenase/reductase SDR [Sphingobium chlorophenolicum L-1]
MTGLFEGQSAIVLGASAEGGSGWAIAEAFAAQGARVAVGARRIEPLERLASKIGGVAVRCDAGQPADIAALFKTATERLGRPSIAVNAAAIPTYGLIADSASLDLQRALDVNYVGNVHFIRHATQAMSQDGSILLISSASAEQPLLPAFPYACSKAAMDCLVRYAAIEYGPRNIRVNSMLPGPIKTEMAARIYAKPGAEAARAKEIALGRVASPEDIAEAAVALVSARYVTGVNLAVSGGMHLTRPARADEIASFAKTDPAGGGSAS